MVLVLTGLLDDHSVARPLLVQQARVLLLDKAWIIRLLEVVAGAALRPAYHVTVFARLRVVPTAFRLVPTASVCRRELMEHLGALVKGEEGALVCLIGQVG